jgi:DNA polymerase III epsilon subunit-like protein
MIGADLLRYQDNQRFLVLDGESNGLNLARSQPWQIAYAVCSLKQIEETVVRYPKWSDFVMSDEAAQVTRFDMKDYLSRAEDANEVLTDFEKLLLDPQYLIVGHNILGFDAYLIQTWRRLCGRSEDWSFVPRMIDTLALSRAYRYSQTPDRTNFLAWQYRMLSIRGSRAKGMGCSLGAMAREFQVPYDERLAHDAGYDIRVNHSVFNQLVWNLEV